MHLGWPGFARGVSGKLGCSCAAAGFGLLALCCPSMMHVELVGFVVVLSATPLLPCRVTSTARLARHTSRKSWPAQMHGTRKEVLTAEHKVKKEDIVFVFHFVFACKN